MSAGRKIKRIPRDTIKISIDGYISIPVNGTSVKKESVKFGILMHEYAHSHHNNQIDIEWKVQDEK